MQTGGGENTWNVMSVLSVLSVLSVGICVSTVSGCICQYCQWVYMSVGIPVSTVSGYTCQYKYMYIQPVIRSGMVADSGTSAILVAQVGEPPNIRQVHSETDDSQVTLQLLTPFLSVGDGCHPWNGCRPRNVWLAGMGVVHHYQGQL